MRIADLSVRAATSRIRPPLEFQGEGREIDVGIIHLRESNPPADSEGLESMPVT
jgi:hypothetical protein